MVFRVLHCFVLLCRLPGQGQWDGRRCGEAVIGYSACLVSWDGTSGVWSGLSGISDWYLVSWDGTSGVWSGLSGISDGDQVPYAEF